MASPDDQEIGTAFSRIYSYQEGEWTFVDFPFWIADIAPVSQFAGETGMLALSEGGLVTRADEPRSASSVYEREQEMRSRYRLGYLQRLNYVAEDLFAVGSGGQVLRCLNAPRQWEPFDEGMLDSLAPNPDWLSRFFDDPSLLSVPGQGTAIAERVLSEAGKNFFGIGGVASGNFYVCGDQERIFWWDGDAFNKVHTAGDPATNFVLRDILISPETEVWVCGNGGRLLRGNGRDGFQQDPAVRGEQNFSSMAAFGDAVYIASTSRPRGLFRHDGNAIGQPLPDIDDVHTVQSVEGALWVVGAKSILKFDGRRLEPLRLPSELAIK